MHRSLKTLLYYVNDNYQHKWRHLWFWWEPDHYFAFFFVSLFNGCAVSLMHHVMAIPILCKSKILVGYPHQNQICGAIYAGFERKFSQKINFCQCHFGFSALRRQQACAIYDAKQCKHTTEQHSQNEKTLKLILHRRANWMGICSAVNNCFCLNSMVCAKGCMA